MSGHGLTNKDFETIRCAHCGEPFPTTPKAPDRIGPDDVPWVDGGIISLLQEDGSELHYHGYFHDRRCCYYQANPEG